MLHVKHISIKGEKSGWDDADYVGDEKSNNIKINIKRNMKKSFMLLKKRIVLGNRNTRKQESL